MQVGLKSLITPTPFFPGKGRGFLFHLPRIKQLRLDLAQWFWISFNWQGCGPWIPITLGCFVPSLNEIGPVSLDMSMNYLHYFAIISPCKSGFFIWTNLNSHDHSKMLCAKYGWKWLRFWNVGNYLPLTKGVILISPSTPNALCQLRLVEIGLVVLG